MLARTRIERILTLMLSDVSAADAGRIGAKAANEAALLKAGFRVPNGFVLTNDAFTMFLAANGISPDGDNTGGSELLDKAPFPAEILDALHAGRLALGDGPLAVRSSAAAEDLPGASFAGQYETVLNVRGPAALEAAVRRCWASAFKEHLVAYRQHQGMAAGSVAVLVQIMVPADVAGVAFTANPVSGARDEVVINAIRGLGERLVSGAASPDEWIVKGQEARRHSAPEDAIGVAEALAIADTARRVERHFGSPQDIEWALAGDRLFVLQSRPITTLPAEAPEMIPIPIKAPPGYWEHDASHFPEPIYPMHRLLFDPMKVAIKNWVEDFGYLFDGMEVAEIGGWVYTRIAPMGGKEGPELPQRLMWLLVRIVPAIRRRLRQAEETMRTDKPGRYVRQWYVDDQPALAKRIAELHKVELGELSDEALNGHIEETRALWAWGIEVHTQAHGSLAIILYELATTCESLLGWDMAKTFALVEGTSFKSTEPARRLHELAELARTRPAVLTLLEEPDLRGRTGESVANRLAEVDQEFAQAFAAYMQAYGCRVLNEISEPTLKETPWLLLEQIRSQIQRDYDPLADQAALAEKRQATATQARQILAGRPDDLARFEEVLQRAELAYPVREDNHFFTGSAPYALIRYGILEIGSRLVAREIIDHRDEIFFLELEEARSALQEATEPGVDVDYRALIRRRKAERAWALANPGPPSYGPEPPPPPDLSFMPGEARLPMEAMLWSMESIFALEASAQSQQAGSDMTGIAASAGEYTGPVRIIMNEGEFEKLRPGDVLVCPVTSPVWSILFPSVGALVTDSGGILSHPAIIAREYRVPAVVATGNATELLKDGQIVTVNGSAGTVEVNV